MSKEKKGHVLVISAPSGAGKTTLCNALRKHFPQLSYSISSTTRPPRPGERHGVDYFFLTKSDFEKQIRQGLWAEWAEVHGNYYGTSAAFLDNKLNKGDVVLMDIDVQGAGQILSRYPDAVSIFISPPSMAVLRSRLESRGTDLPGVIQRRIENAEGEMAKKGMYRYHIVNDDLAQALAELISIVSVYIDDLESQRASDA